MKTPLALAAGLLVMLATAPPAQAVDYDGAIPCSDPRGCPDLLMDEVQMLAGSNTLEPWFEEDCAVQEGATEAGLRQLLRFTFTTPNLGLGDLIVGGPDQFPELFEYHPCHDHFHFKEYADYRLWVPEKHAEWEAFRAANPDMTASEALAANPDLAAGLVKGEKRGFCVIDIAPAGPNTRHAPVVPDADGKYVDCNTSQGISVGWADTYDPTLDGQWIDVTDVAPGAYILEAEVNAERVYEEMDYSNNRGFVPTVVAPGPSNGPVEADAGLELDLAVEVAGYGVGIEGSLDDGFVISLTGFDEVFALLDEQLGARR